jgi:hypothetical protein
MSSTLEFESTLASVVGSPDLGSSHYSKWLSKRLPDDDPFNLFRVKFWGQSLAEEEQVWREAHPATGGGLRGKDQDGDESMGEGGGEITDVDDDIIPGCYLLDLDIETINPMKIWIRADYIRVYNHVETYYETPGFPPNRAPCVVLAGQPGIGKSLIMTITLS